MILMEIYSFSQERIKTRILSSRPLYEILFNAKKFSMYLLKINTTEVLSLIIVLHYRAFNRGSVPDIDF